MALTYVNQVGAVEGMNQAAPGTLIPDSFVRWSQDVLFDRAGLVRRRGPFGSALAANSIVATSGSTEERVISVTSCLNPLNERIVANVVYRKTSDGVQNTRLYFYKDASTLANDDMIKQAGESVLVAPFGLSTVVDSKAALGGGAWIGLLEKYGVAKDVAGSRQALYFWRGGCGVEGTKTPSSNVSYDNTTISISDTSGLTSGMFVYADTNKYVGVIKQVNSDNIILEKKPFKQTAFTGTNVLTFKNVRPYIHRHGRGLITKTFCNNGNPSHPHAIISGDAGTLSEGHWGAAGIGEGGYSVYSAKDNTWIGNIRTNDGNDSDVTNISAILLANQHIVKDFNADEYVMFKVDQAEPSALVSTRTATNFTGVFNATYANYQWFGCLGLENDTNRIVFSATHDPEAVDLSKDAADSIIIPGNQEMRGMASSASGLVVFMEDKTYLIRGNTRFNFSLEVLYPQGCISSASIVETGGGVMWASRAGILYYDGASVRNFTADNLGVYYSDGVTTFNPDNDNCYGFLYRDYAFFHFTNWNNTYTMTRYEPIYANEWADGVITDDDNTIVDAATSAAEGLAGQSWTDFKPDKLTWSDISVAKNEPIGWDYEAERPDNMTFAIYLPTGAITTISNFAFRGATFQESLAGLKALIGFTRAPTYTDEDVLINNQIADIIQIDTMLDSIADGFDHAQSCTCHRLGPDLYLQTKHYIVGDPMLKKWFQKLMINLMLERGAVRVDFIDSEDKDAFDVFNLKHKNWEVFAEKGLLWEQVERVILPKVVSPAASTWGSLEHPDYPDLVFKGYTNTLPSSGNTEDDGWILNSDNSLYIWLDDAWVKVDVEYTWLNLLFADYERQSKRFSLRQSSVGFRLYQLNNYREVFQTIPTKPRKIQSDAWNIGFKPLRGGRV